MVDVIPSFFNKADFWAMLLPGYVAVILGMILFSPNILFNKNNTLPFDLFLAVVFIVAGPAVGFTLSQLNFLVGTLFYALYGALRQREQGGFKRKYEYYYEYARLRLKCDEDERSELEEVEARLNFGHSTGTALITLSILCFIIPLRQPYSKVLVAVSIAAVGIALMLGATYYNKNIRLPLVCKLTKKYKIKRAYHDKS